MTSRYDGIVLGAGHNALVLQAYLCRCGLRVAAFDRASTAGGGLATVENPRLPGFWHNTHSFFHRALTAMPWYADLQLDQGGAKYIEPALNVAMLLRDGRSLQWWTDFDRTLDSVSQFSPRDAGTLKRWRDEFIPIVEQILIPEAQSPPLPTSDRIRLLSMSRLGRRLLEVSRMSPLEFVGREFESDVVRAGLLFFNGLREVDLRQQGLGHSIPALLASRHMAQMCIGGSRQLAQALLGDIQAHGGTVVTDVDIESIVVESGRATGIRLADGSLVVADRFVASGLNPQQTFVELLDPSPSHESLRRSAKAFRFNQLAPLFALNVALRERPRYRHADNDPNIDDAFMVILGLERFDQFNDIVKAHERGTIPETVMWGACPTQFDASQAPTGQHTAFMWEKLPFAVRGDANQWNALKDAHGLKMLDVWRDSAPNLHDDVLDCWPRSPLDIVRSLPNMALGDLLVGSFANGQVGAGRPFAAAGTYRTPIAGLYLCGGSTHPGGNITGLCGYNAARVIAEDLHEPLWWTPPDAKSAFRHAAE